MASGIPERAARILFLKRHALRLSQIEAARRARLSTQKWWRLENLCYWPTAEEWRAVCAVIEEPSLVGVLNGEIEAPDRLVVPLDGERGR